MVLVCMQDWSSNIYGRWSPRNSAPIRPRRPPGGGRRCSSDILISGSREAAPESVADDVGAGRSHGPRTPRSAPRARPCSALCLGSATLVQLPFAPTQIFWTRHLSFIVQRHSNSVQMPPGRFLPARIAWPNGYVDLCGDGALRGGVLCPRMPDHISFR